MNHEKYKELLELNVLGELNNEEEIELENHLFECDECTRDYAKMKKMYAVITTERTSAATDEDLLTARMKLFTTINKINRKPSFSDRFIEFWRSIYLNKYSFAFGSIALILIGLFAGYLMFNNSSSVPQISGQNIIDLDDLENDNVKISKIRFPEVFDNENKFEFLIGDSKSISYKGSLNDIVVQKLLASALRETENPGFKIKAANTIAELIGGNFVPDKKIKDAFIYTLKNDQNPGVRKEALNALVNFPYDKEIQDVLIFTLTNDENASNRMDAINALLSMNFSLDIIDEKSRTELNQGFVKEENEVIKFKTAKLLLGGN